MQSTALPPLLTDLPVILFASLPCFWGDHLHRRRWPSKDGVTFREVKIGR